ncbi:MAG: HAMP domain-containing protein [Acidobacteriaceae bacterium]|nr:HAMP domain-containing protein [Acidobacteriaceae bacterium]
MKERSIRTRLMVWYTVVLSIALILFSGTVWIALQQALYGDLKAMLTNQARGLEEYLRIENGDPSVQLRDEVDEYSRSLLHPHLLTVWNPNGQLIYENSRGITNRVSPAGEKEFADKSQSFWWGGKHYLATGRSVPLGENTIRIFLAVTSDPVDRSLNLLALLLVMAVPAFIMCGAAGGYWLSRKALSPVDSITERARTIGVTNLSERLNVPRTNDELQRLTETWNDMLGRLEVAVSRISQFTADASHELRTPVAIIRLAAENALRKTRSESDYRKALRQIQSESESMTQLIEDLLFLARAEVHNSSIKLAIVDLQAVVKTVCLDLNPLAEAKSITLTQDVPECPISVLGDFSALRRVLLILLDNAIKYTPEGGVVTVGLHEQSETAVLTVEDTGIGIPEEAQNHVFQRFFRVDPSRNKESGGHGLGLAIAQTIVDQHQASLKLQSKSSGGCIFSVSLTVAA